MEQVTIYLLGIAGVIFHFVLKYYDAYTKKELFDVKGHSLLAGLSLVFTIVLIYAFDFLPKEFMPFETLNPFTTFMIGYMADSMLKNISNFTGKN